MAARSRENAPCGLDGAIVHDLHPSRGGLLEIRYFGVLVPVVAAG